MKNLPARYYAMLKHWTAMAGGRSYWHQQQGIGRAFRPGELHGYFNDLTAKAVWPGEVDAMGLPLCKAAGRKIYWPTTVLQKGLAHWDLWLESGRSAEEHWNNFRNVAQWALETQDARGGWAHPVPLSPHALSVYSCMSQGQGISLLMRAWRETGEAEYLEAATRAVHAMLAPVSCGGTSVQEGQHIVLDEYPNPEFRPVLNGWIFAIFGLYDHQLGAYSQELTAALDATLRGLLLYLPKFDCGFWSFYDTGGSIASPFYHALHIAQLDALSRAIAGSRDHFEYWRDRFRQQMASRLKTTCAVGWKAAQKLRHPPTMVLETQ